MADLADVLGAVGDPIRFEVLRLLATRGPSAQSALAERLGLTPSRLGNHLAALRASGLVRTSREGRSTRYDVTDPDAVRALIAAVESLALDVGAPSARTPGDEGELSAFARARTCYDHLAGDAGVRLLDRLVAEGALIPGPDAESVLTPGDGLAAALERLDVDYPDVGRRKLAIGCLDATAGRPHLGGALGGEILRTFVRRGLLTPGPSPRSLIEHPALATLLEPAVR
ncbi:ArsR/SmtB family transcription factor [Cryptosporangium phraense]|uniref:Metalloregulator ArsR/SmtB family transcription factor n=1 Tax=Cryptosporangium phraense TaxID=2593070 RepID=A0A545AQL4_9ACTN|nr:metalloregulator ArsR/SmtB family transcription factor [Cryptosporangium phraense]TQS43563.1 metalloregulator ArsR/SmtB family transcription factor [Cryptosporangium phraense]